MNDEDLKKMQLELEDPAAKIPLFSDYVNQEDQSADRADTLTATTQQDVEDLLTTIANYQNGFDGFTECQNAQQDLYESSTESQFQLPVQDALLTQDNIQGQKQNGGVAMMILNNENQIEEAQNGPNFSTINWRNVEDNSQYPPIIDLKPAINYSIALEEGKTFQNNNNVLVSTNFPNQVSNVKPFCIQITTKQNSMKKITSIPGPLRNRVGRTPKDEVPLYLQPEPENELEKRKWHRAKIAFEHRNKKKTALVDNAKKIEDIVKEMNELKTQLQVVTVERNTYKKTLDSLMIRTRVHGTIQKHPMNLA